MLYAVLVVLSKLMDLYLVYNMVALCFCFILDRTSILNLSLGHMPSVIT